ncbi:MAG TPA: hypothetical protein VFC84_03570 [Desulfosporosinus sp.]|nr:hypothetical protein [Desulfosporosinus sp.]
MRKNLVNILLYLVLTLILAGIIAFVITHYYGLKFIDALFWVGIISSMVGAMSSISGNSTGSHIGSGGIDSQYQSFAIIETLRVERESTNYFANFKKQALFDPKVSGISVILAGVLLIFTSYFLS